MTDTWRELVRRAVVAALVALAVSATARATGSTVSVGVPAAIVGALFAAGLVRAALRATPVIDAVPPLISFRRRTPPPDRRPAALNQLEQLLVLGGDPQFGRGQRLRRRLEDLTDEHLAASGIEAADPDAVRRALGEDAAAALRGDGPMTPADVDVVLDAIERLRPGGAPGDDPQGADTMYDHDPIAGEWVDHS
ncbi:MAG: hypothetical protein S0880_35355 [Actinomycetota bacterium]|nr:hypothetical protein [Actinomycetota bacterium]